MVKLGTVQNEIWLISPEDAENYLKRNNQQNRTPSSSAIHKYAEAMKNGTFPIMPQPLVFNRNGVLDDGQQRLNAVIAAGVPVAFEVRLNADPELFAHYDDGKARNVRDYVHLKNNSIAAGIATFAFCLDQGRLNLENSLRGHLYAGTDKGKRYNVAPSRDAIAKYAADHASGIEQAASDAQRMYRAIGVGGKKTYGAALWTIRLLCDDDLTDDFVEEFCKDVPDSKTVSAGRTTIMSMYVKGSRPTEIRLFGTVLDIYEKFIACTDSTRFSSWARTVSVYEKKLSERRASKRCVK